MPIRDIIINPPQFEERRVVLAVAEDKALSSLDLRYFDHLSLTILATRNSGAETLTVYREEAMAGNNWKRMEQLALFDGNGSVNLSFNLRHKFWRLFFDVSASADYSLEIAWTARPRLGFGLPFSQRTIDE